MTPQTEQEAPKPKRPKLPKKQTSVNLRLDRETAAERLARGLRRRGFA